MPLNVTVCPTIAGFGAAVNDAVGGRLPITVSVRTVTSVAPPLSVTRSRRSKVPSVVYDLVTTLVVPELVSKVPSPSRSHSYFVIVPSGSADEDASKVTVSVQVSRLRRDCERPDRRLIRPRRVGGDLIGRVRLDAHVREDVVGGLLDP